MKPAYNLLPAGLAEQLRAAARRLRCVQAVAVSAATAGAVVAATLTVFAADRVCDTPAALRLACFVAAWTALVLAVAVWTQWRWQQLQHPEALLKLVQQRFPCLGDSLQGAADLAATPAGEGNVSPVLREAAIAQVAKRCESLAFGDAVNTRPARRAAGFCLAAVAVSLAAAAVAPAAWVNALHRWCQPLAAVPRYTFVRFAPVPGSLRIPHGEPVEMPLRLDPASSWQPGAVQWTIGGRSQKAAPLQGGLARLSLPGQTAETVVEFRAGDATGRVTLVPTHRPVLRQLRARLVFPEYLQLPTEDRECLLQALTVPEGSTLELQGTVSRELTAAALAGRHAAALTVRGAAFSSPAIAAAELAEARLTWTDRFGFQPAEPYVLAVRAQADELPVALCAGLPGAVALLEDETLSIKLHARDDFGLRQLGVTWEVQLPGEAEPQPVSRCQREVSVGGPAQKTLDGVFRFAPGQLAIPPRSTIFLAATAADYHPEHAVAKSPVHRLYVLSRVDHARYLEEKLAALQSRVEDVVRAEEELKRQNEETGRLSDEALRVASATAPLQAGINGETDNTKRLRAIVAEGTGLLREALRNQDVPASAIRQWSKLFDDLHQIGVFDMPKVVDTLVTAREVPGDRRRQLTDAIALQEAILQKLAGAGKGAAEARQNIAARNFAARLREAGNRERDIGDLLKVLAPQVAGLATDALPAETAARLDAAVRNQADVKNRAQRLSADILAFAARTKLPAYEEVAKDMEAKKLVEALERLAKDIAGNRIIAGIPETERWRQAFNAWAFTIEKSATDGGGEGGGGGGGNDQNMELVIAILRVVQKQQDLYDETLFVETNRAGMKDYAVVAGGLATRQGQVAAETTALADKTPKPEIKEGLRQVGTVMGEAAGLLRTPQTDTPVTAAQAAAIEMLTANASSACKSAEACQTLLAMMQQMKGQQKGQGGGATPGGSLPGGSGATTAAPTAGPAGETGAVRAGPGKVSGHSGDALPAEFREALENYFRRLEGTP